MFLFDHLRCVYTGDLIQDNQKYSFSINAGSWLTISTNDTTLYYGDRDVKLTKYFLSEPWNEPHPTSKVAEVICTNKANTKSLGIGIITLASDSFAIYDDKNLSNLFWSDNVYNVTNNNQKCCARSHKPDYGILNFVCLNQTESYYKINSK